MKVITIFCIALLICSCHNVPSQKESKHNTMTRHDVIRKIMRNCWINGYETGNFYWMSAEEHEKLLSELHKMKEDYYYIPDPNHVLTIPGPGWKIRGPLSITDFDKWDESNEFIKEYREGDELYFYSSDDLSWAYLRGTEGYVIIRDNKVINRISTRIN